MSECTLNFNKSWKDIFTDPEWMFKTGMGGVFNAVCLVLFAASPLFFPIVFALISLLCGYLLRVIRTKYADPQSPLPQWNNWVQLLVSGLTWLVIELVLTLAIVSAAALALVIGMVTNAINPLSQDFVSWFSLSTTLIMAVWLLLSLFRPFLMVNFAVKEQLSAGLDLVLVWSRLKKCPSKFLVVWLVCLGLGLASVYVPVMTVIGIFFLPTTVFLGYLSSALIAAEAWRLSGCQE